jgi:hypothetical protein
MTDITATGGTLPWYRSLTTGQWRALIATNLGWLFDGYETYALILTVGAAMHSLLEPGQYSQIPGYAGTIIAITLLGWGIGGFCGGILADYIGRKRFDGAVVQLDFVCASALCRRHRYRLGMGDRLVDDGRALAAERAR